MRPRGHRLLPHTADVIVEAGGPDLASCCEEAIAALAATYVDARRARVVDQRVVHLPPSPEEALLVEAVEEVIFTLDTSRMSPSLRR